MATKKKARRKSSKIGKGVGSVELGRAEIGLAKGIHHILIGDQGRFSKIFVFTSGQNDLVYKKMLDWGLTHPADVVLFPDPSIEGYRAHKDSFRIKGNDLPVIIMVNKDFNLSGLKSNEVKELKFTMNTPLLKDVLGPEYNKLWGVLEDLNDVCRKEGFDAAYDAAQNLFAIAWGKKVGGLILGIVRKKVGL